MLHCSVPSRFLSTRKIFSTVHIFLLVGYHVSYLSYTREASLARLWTQISWDAGQLAFGSISTSIAAAMVQMAYNMCLGKRGKIMLLQGSLSGNIVAPRIGSLISAIAGLALNAVANRRSRRFRGTILRRRVFLEPWSKLSKSLLLSSSSVQL